VFLVVGCGSANGGDDLTLGGEDSGSTFDIGDGSTSGDGGGFDVGEGGSGDDAGATGDCSPNLTGRLRDFVNKPGFTPASALDDDFENVIADDRGMVATDLGADKKPVYANPGGTTPTTHGKTKFDAWYRD